MYSPIKVPTQWWNDTRKYKSIQECYAIANAEYFENCLPAIPVKFACFNKTNHKDCIGRMVLDNTNQPLRIEISRSIKDNASLVIMTLLHEMAHVSEYISGNCGDKDPYREVDPEEFHSPIWQEIMKRLAREGALERLW